MKARVSACALSRKHWPFSLSIVLALVNLGVAPVVCGSDTAHLVPVEPDFGVSQPLGGFFKTTYEKTLFRQKDWLIRYYRADTPVNVTIGFSIYLKDQNSWVNVSHATPEMDPLIRDAAEKDKFDVSSVLRQIDLKPFDFPISQSTATALGNVWRSLLSEVRPDPSLRHRVFTDGPLVILFAKDESNQILAGRIPPSAEQDAKFRHVEQVFTDLMKACTASKKERTRIYRDIEARSQGISKKLRAERQDSNNRSAESAKAHHRKQSLDVPHAAFTRTLALFSNTTEQRPDLPLANPAQQHRDVINQLSPTEQKIVGAWSWTYIEGVGRIIFTADHTVKAGFPPDDKDGRSISDDEFHIVQAGTWRLEGGVLITEMDNRPLINILEHLDPSNRPALENKVERRKIVRIDDIKIVFDNGSSFDRVKR